MQWAERLWDISAPETDGRQNGNEEANFNRMKACMHSRRPMGTILPDLLNLRCVRPKRAASRLGQPLKSAMTDQVWYGELKGLRCRTHGEGQRRESKRGVGVEEVHAAGRGKAAQAYLWLGAMVVVLNLLLRVHAATLRKLL
jgi:hypothetical protein